MAEAARTIQIFDPRAEDVPEELGLNDKLPTLNGKVVGLLENRKYHADAFLQELREVLLDQYGAEKVVYKTKFTYSAACDPDVLDSLSQECDVVIHAIAD